MSDCRRVRNLWLRLWKMITRPLTRNGRLQEPMPRYLEHNRPYRLADYSREESPARHVEMGLWPKRGFIPSPVYYQEWFDWSELFTEGAAERLFSISKAFSSSSIRLACLLTDSPAKETRFIRVVELDREDLSDCYFKAIWDEQSTSLPAPLGVAARMVLVGIAPRNG